MKPNSDHLSVDNTDLILLHLQSSRASFMLHTSWCPTDGSPDGLFGVCIRDLGELSCRFLRTITKLSLDGLLLSVESGDQQQRNCRAPLVKEPEQTGRRILYIVIISHEELCASRTENAILLMLWGITHLQICLCATINMKQQPCMSSRIELVTLLLIFVLSLSYRESTTFDCPRRSLSIILQFIFSNQINFQ
jgi:hypothetical protein